MKGAVAPLTVERNLKEGRALRTETTFNDPYDIDVGRRIDNLPLLREQGEAISTPGCSSTRRTPRPHGSRAPS